MEENKLVWCLKIKTGVKLTLPSEEEYISYIQVAKEDLDSLKNGNTPKRWVPVVAYYCVYYAIYGVLRLVGIKSENHSCSLEIFKYVLAVIEEDVGKVVVVEELKRKREEAQYYLKEVEIDLDAVDHFLNYVLSLKNKILLKREHIRNSINELIDIANREEI